MTIKEKLAYVKGLVEGLELDPNKPEVKVLSELVDLLDNITKNVSDLEDSYDDLADKIDEIDADLGCLEDDFYEEEPYCKCDEVDDGVFYEVTCPKCNETVCVSEPILLDGRIDCPNCGENLEFDLDGLSLKDKCGCNDHCDCDPYCDCEPECDCESENKCETDCNC